MEISSCCRCRRWWPLSQRPSFALAFLALAALALALSAFDWTLLVVCELGLFGRQFMVLGGGGAKLLPAVNWSVLGSLETCIVGCSSVGRSTTIGCSWVWLTPSVLVSIGWNWALCVFSRGISFLLPVDAVVADLAFSLLVTC